MFLNKLKSKCLEKEGTEILQTLIIIAVVGAVAVTMGSMFRNQLYGSVGDKLADSTGDYAVTEQTKGSLSETLKSSGQYDGKQKISYNK